MIGDHYLERNTTEGFARRVRENLEFVTKGRREGEDVHQVTQLVTSLLGLIVFPWEAGALARMEEWCLEELEKNGWPKWTIVQDRNGETATLGKLIYHLRNAAAHRRIGFSSDDADMEEVVIHFEDARPKKPVDWRAEIQAADLQDFCVRFSRSLEELTG